MLIKIQETKSNLMAMASEKLDEITKRTILENDQLKMELRFQVRCPYCRSFITVQKPLGNLRYV